MVGLKARRAFCQRTTGGHGTSWSSRPKSQDSPPVAEWGGGASGWVEWALTIGGCVLSFPKEKKDRYAIISCREGWGGGRDGGIE